jgi:hypothetical protein
MFGANLVERNLKFHLQQRISEVDGRHYGWGPYNSMTIRRGFQTAIGRFGGPETLSKLETS